MKSIAPKKALATNLRKMRSHFKFTQAAVARALGIQAGTYQKYEEGYAEPSAERLVQIADFFQISNLRAFISDPDFDYENEDRIPPLNLGSPLQSNYIRLQPKERAIVDILLGLRDIE